MRAPTEQPLAVEARYTYSQVCRKVENWYGVADAESWYTRERKRIMDGCKPDPFGLHEHATLRAYWEAKQQEAKWLPPAGAQISTGTVAA